MWLFLQPFVPAKSDQLMNFKNQIHSGVLALSHKYSCDSRLGCSADLRAAGHAGIKLREPAPSVPGSI